MAKTVVGTERTSSHVASLAGRLLGGKSLREAETWLHEVATSDTSEEEQSHAVALIGLIASMRTLAASALTQR